MKYEDWLGFIKVHKGKIIGILLGLVFGILVLSIGFWQTIFLSICIYIGYAIGGMTDKKEKFMAFLDKILPTGFK